MTAKSYRADEVSVNIKGRLVEGYGEDEFVSIEMSAPRTSKTTGSDGEVVFSQTADKSGSITITLLQTSAANDYFQEWLDRNERGPGLEYRPIVVRDLNGRAKFSAPHCTVEEEPQVVYGRSASMRAWKLGFARRDPGGIRGSAGAP
jgi:phage terminase large subunit GpA-like protein